MVDWYRQEPEQVLEQLDTQREGLSEEEAQKRLEEHGPNELEERRGRSPWRILASQFTEIMVIVLLVAATISFSVGEMTDGIMIMIIVILNAILGFTQEYRAERAMAALKELAVPTVKVRRGGNVREVESTKLVPGDVILLEAGSRIPADIRILDSVILTILLQLAVIYLPFMQTIFETVPLTLEQLGVCFAFSSIVFVAVEIVKWIKRRSGKPYA
ncbi:MAG: cation-translocating P-type ATPase [Chloroflexota bacterium]|nr:cation-translocating P-type ATPase [Chloroflexota bacterium]